MSGSNVKKELLQYILLKTKENDLSLNTAKQFINEIGNWIKEDDETMAIIGMACRFPDANGPYEFWDNMAKGKNSIREFPEPRFQDAKRAGCKIDKSMRGGFLEQIDQFDPEYFNIPPKAALHMDPYHRMLLEVFVETIEDAGYCTKHLKGSNTGVFVGNDLTHRLATSYFPFIGEHEQLTIVGSWTSILASHISYLLDLRGPAIVLDSGCSSALIALDNAIKAIRQGDCKMALVGGINLLFTPSNFSDDTVSKHYTVYPFDHRASGTVWSEGVGAVYIKPLSKAVADNDYIYGVIKGIAVNNDGKSNGITAPNAKAQKDVIKKAWKRANINPETLSYIETHGTGTKLGDPIEIKSLSEAFTEFTNRRQFCALGSVKSNIGHTVGAAGIASVIKVLLAMKYRMIPPIINFEKPNQYIDFCNSPLYIQDKLTHWKTEGFPLRAGISGFSFGGTNCHLVLEDAPEDKRKAEEIKPHIFPVSGRNQKMLKANIRKLVNYLNTHLHLRMEDISYTLSVGREHQRERIVVICSTLKQLLDGLKKLEENPALKLSNHTKENENIYNLMEVFNQYVDGEVVDFEKLYYGEEVKRTSLPPQVFDNRRFWDESVNRGAEITEEGNDVIHDKPSMIKKAIKEGKTKLDIGTEVTNTAKEIMAYIWSSELGYPIIHTTDDFFALGGDSIISLRIIQIINDTFGLELPPSILLEHSVFSNFVTCLVNHYGFMEVIDESLDRHVKNEVTKKDNTMNSELPLSPAQNRIYLTMAKMPNTVAYNVIGISSISIDQSIEQIESIVKELINRHDSLRCSFHIKDGYPIQRIHSHVEFQIEKYYLEECHEKEKREVILRQQLNDFIRPFNIEEAPLIRVGYFSFGKSHAYLAIDIHHLVTDGTSMGIIFRDYLRLSSGEKLAPLTFGYSDAVIFMYERMQKEKMQSQKNWWINQFKDIPPMLNLPADRLHQGSNRYEGSRIFYTIDADITRQIKEQSRQQNVTLFMFLLGSFQILLSKLSDSNDIVIGTSAMGRPKIEYQDIVGMFVNTLPLRITSNDNQTFLKFMKQVRTTVIEAFDNQEYPYELLLDDLKIERISGKNPLFDTCFVLQNIDMGLSDARERFITYDTGHVKFDLTVSATETENGLEMEWEFSSIYNESTILRMAKRYQYLLSSILENPEKILKDLSVFALGEEEMLLNQWDHIDTPRLENLSIVSWFEEYAKIKGDSAALVLGEEQLSYRELNKRSNQIARYLLSQGIKPKMAVALMLDRSFDMISSIIGVLKAGCCYVPISTDFPVDRIQIMCQDSDAKLLIAHRKYASIMKENIPVLIIDDFTGECIADDNLHVEVSIEDRAYIMYTSGTTGIPKGVAIKHKNIIRVVKNTGYIELNHNDVLLQLSNYSFDGSVFDIFGALVNGCTLVLLNTKEVIDAAYLASIIRLHKVTVFFVTTALFNALADTCIECFDTTRKVLFGGEACSITHVSKVFNRLGKGRIIHVYGPTESTVFATAYLIEHIDEKVGLPIGKPIRNTNVYILDEDMKIQPIGVSGELYIGGNGLAEGYLNKKDISDKYFVENIYKKGETIYKTGDLAMFKEDGNIYFMGRLDHQIKFSGFRIEPREIELVAIKYENVKEAYADLYISKDGVRNLCLWIVPQEGTEINENVLRNTLSKMLPSYMVPSFIVNTEAFSLNKNGKIDKNLLPPPAFKKEMMMETKMSAEEKAIADVWSNVLGIEVLNKDANFFSLGGDSIKAILVVGKLKTLNYSLQINDIFECQTIANLAKRLKRCNYMNNNQSEIFGQCQMNPIQKMFVDVKENINLRFNQAVLVNYGVRLDFDIVKEALSKICIHHDFLRVIVTNDNDLWIRPIKEGNLCYVEEAPPGLQEDALKDYFIKIQNHINIHNGPLAVAAVGLGNEGTEIFIAIHHMAVDVVSWGILLSDFASLIANPEAQLLSKTNSFSSWVNALNQWILSPRNKHATAFWCKKEVLDSAKKPIFPKVFVPLKDTAIVNYISDGKYNMQSVNELAYSTGYKVEHIVLFIFTYSLYLWKKCNSILINLEGHGRDNFDDSLDITRTVGWFTSNYPALIKVEQTIEDTLFSIKKYYENVYNKGFEFGAFKYLSKGLDIGLYDKLNSIEPQISFNYLGKLNHNNDNNIAVKYLSSDITIDECYMTKWVIDAIAALEGSRLQISLQYPKAMFGDRDIEDLLFCFDEALSKVVNYLMALEQGELLHTTATLSKKELEDILDDLNI